MSQNFKLLRNIVALIIFSIFLSNCSPFETGLIVNLFPTLQPLPERLTLPTINAENILDEPTSTSVSPEIKPSATPTTQPIPSRTPQPSLTPSATIAPLVAYGPEIFPDHINPLTGKPVADLALMNRQPIAMKIPLMPRGSARPQWGLSLADHVYEYYLEKGITRFIAIFFGNNAERAGPIRSGRLFDEEIMEMYHGVLVFNSAFETIYDHFVENGFLNQLVVERTDGPLYRVNNIPEPSNLFANTEDISNYVSERGSSNAQSSLSGMYFRTYSSPGEALVGKIEVRYSESSYHRWVYNPIEQSYFRFQDADEAFKVENEVYEPLIDQLSNQQISADNIVVLYVDHEYFYKSSDTEIFQMDLTGSGNGFLFREGYAYPITWERIATDQLLRIKAPSGKTAEFKFGETWFTVIHSASQLSVDGNFWRFKFVLPEEPETTLQVPQH